VQPGFTVNDGAGAPGWCDQRAAAGSFCRPARFEQSTGEGFATWNDYWRDFGLGEDDLGMGEDRIVDPEGHGPRIWFQIVPEGKTIKNRLHLDISVGGDRSVPIQERKRRVDVEAQRLVALGATLTASPISADGLDHYGVAMTDPEGNEFDIN
jgi:hypothetical protein